MDESTLDRIIEACSSESRIDQALSSIGLSPMQEPHDDFCVLFAERIARQYLAGKLSFEQADTAANWLHGYSYAMDGSQGHMPTFALSVFDAFDSGEYYHEGDKEDVDPELRYTKPELEELLREVDAREDIIDLEAYRNRKDERRYSLEEIIATTDTE
jgi:hypothetical protein